MNLHYKTQVVLALCSLSIAACSSKGVNPTVQTRNSPAVDASAVQSLAAQNTELSPQKGSPQFVEFTESVPNELLACSGTPAEFKATFLKLLNDARAVSRQCGTTSHDPVPAVRWNESLLAAALQHSVDMTENNFFSHTGSDRSSVADRVDAIGYPWQTVGENIAAGQRSAREAMDGWLSSPGHCRNIMSPEYREVAVTCVKKTPTEYTTYWTNVFGSVFE